MVIAHCPECGEEIQLRAGSTATCAACGTRVKSKSAKSAPIDDDEPPMVRPAPSKRFARSKGESSIGCPECGSRYLRPGPWPWYLGTIGAMLCKAVVCEDCGHEFDAKKPQAHFPTRKRNLAIGINAVGLFGIIIVLTLLYIAIRASMRH